MYWADRTFSITHRLDFEYVKIPAQAELIDSKLVPLERLCPMYIMKVSP